MAKFIAISKTRHTGCSWQRFNSYTFARERTVVPLVAAEMARAALAFPIGFLISGEGFMPTALLSLDGARNLFVAADGRWLGRYVPAVLRGYPFALLANTEDNRVLCIDEASCLSLENASGEPFFDEAGEVAEPTRKVLRFLTAMEAHRAATAKACVTLTEAGVIVPWDITLKTSAGAQKISGLHKIDEAALTALSVESFETLRQAGAVPLAYCQILSMQHLPALGRLADAHAAQRQEVETIMKQSFRPPEANEIDIDWASFSDEGPEKGTT
jgi:hypothetical protein